MYHTLTMKARDIIAFEIPIHNNLICFWIFALNKTTIQSNEHYIESHEKQIAEQQMWIAIISMQLNAVAFYSMHFSSKHCIQNVIVKMWICGFVNKSSITILSKLKRVSLTFYYPNKMIRCISQRVEQLLSFDNLDRFSFLYLHFL